MRINLLELELVRGDWFSALVEDEEARAGGALVYGPDENVRSTTHCDDFFQQIHKNWYKCVRQTGDKLSEMKLEAWRDAAEEGTCYINMAGRDRGMWAFRQVELRVTPYLCMGFLCQ